MLSCKYSYQIHQKIELFVLVCEGNKNNMYENQSDAFYMFAARLIFLSISSLKSKKFITHVLYRNAKTSTLTFSRQRLHEDPQCEACAICLYFRLRLLLDLRVGVNKC